MIPDGNFTLDKAKAHLRVVHALEDALITAYLDAAVAAVERYTRRAWTERNWSTFIDACDLEGCCEASPAVFHALLSPAVGVVNTFDSGGADVPMDPSAFYHSTRYGHTVIRVRDWGLAPDVVGNVGRVDWTAKPQGDEVPPDVYAAAMLYLGDLYVNREAQLAGMVISPNAMAEMLVRPYVVEFHA